MWPINCGVCKQTHTHDRHVDSCTIKNSEVESKTSILMHTKCVSCRLWPTWNMSILCYWIDVVVAVVVAGCIWQARQAKWLAVTVHNNLTRRPLSPLLTSCAQQAVSFYWQLWKLFLPQQNAHSAVCVCVGHARSTACAAMFAVVRSGRRRVSRHFPLR